MKFILTFFLTLILTGLTAPSPAWGDLLDAKTKCSDETAIMTSLQNGILNVVYRGDRTLHVPISSTVLDFLFLNFSKQTLLDGLSFTLEPETLYGYSFETNVIVRAYATQLEVHYRSLSTYKQSYWFAEEPKVDGYIGFYWVRSEPRNLALKLITLKETYLDTYTRKVFEIDNSCKVRN
jgi:hypothetical protein